MRGQYMRGQKTKQKREISEVKINAENIKKAQPILIFAEKMEKLISVHTLMVGQYHVLINSPEMEPGQLNLNFYSTIDLVFIQDQPQLLGISRRF